MNVSDFFVFLRGLVVFLEVLLIFNIIIVAHEAGHFLAARWRGLKVDKFGVWFGPPIFKFSWGGVEFILGCIPAGGFVSIPQMANPEMIEGRVEGGLPEVKPVDKMIVAFAGPVASVVCGFVFAGAVWGVGKPVYEAETATTIGYIVDGGGAQEAGLEPGDRILSIDGRKIEKFSGFSRMKNSVLWNIARSEGGEVSMIIDRRGVDLEKNVRTSVAPNETVGRRKLPQIGISPATTPLILKALEGGPAEEAGIVGGDIILSVNGERIYSPIRANEMIDQGGLLTVVLRRGGQDLEVTVFPREKGAGQGSFIGIEWDFESIKNIEHPNPFDQVRGAFSVMTETLGAVFSSQTEIGAQHLSGPVGIMRLYYLLFEMPDGWRIALWFSVIFNINLAILNLLPIPVLDGGHIVLAMVEGVRRKKINARVVAGLQTGCAVLILTFMMYVTGYDILDYIGEKLATR